MQRHRPGGATRDGGEPSWACANGKHDGCRGVNCTCPHHKISRRLVATALKLAKRLTGQKEGQNG